MYCNINNGQCYNKVSGLCCMYCNKTMVSVTARYQDCVLCIAIKQRSCYNKVSGPCSMYCNKTKVMLQQGIRTVFYVLQ